MIESIIASAFTKKLVIAAVGLGTVAIVIDPTIFAAAIVTVITAITGSVVIIINAVWNAKKELLEAQALLLEKSELYAHTITAIKTSVDGMTTKAESKRTADSDTIAGLRQQLIEAEARATALAQAARATGSV